MAKYPIFLLILLIVGTSVSLASPYELDDVAIDLLFDQAEIISPEQALLQYEAEIAQLMQSKVSGKAVFDAMGSDRQIGAVVLCFIVGGLGIHRVFLGGRGALIAFYFCTGGGCGVVWLVDFIILITDGTNRFENNDRFIAW